MLNEEPPSTSSPVQSFQIKLCSRAEGPHSSGPLCSRGPCLQSSGRCGSLSTCSALQAHRKLCLLGENTHKAALFPHFFLSKPKDERSTVSAERERFSRACSQIPISSSSTRPETAASCGWDVNHASQLLNESFGHSYVPLICLKIYRETGPDGIQCEMALAAQIAVVQAKVKPSSWWCLVVRSRLSLRSASCAC